MTGWLIGLMLLIDSESFRTISTCSVITVAMAMLLRNFGPYGIFTKVCVTADAVVMPFVA